MNRLLPIVLAAVVSPALADTSASQPSTAAAYGPGLAVSVYKMPRVPKRVRKLLPGQRPDAFDTIASLQIRSRDDLGGLDNNIQADVVGEFLADVDGDYEFEAESDDGIELSLDGQFVLADHWVNGSAPPTRAKVPLSAGWHAIRVGFYQGDGGLGFKIRVKPAHDDAFIDVPAEALRHDETKFASDKSSATTSPATTQADAPWRSLYRSPAFGRITEDESELLVDLLEGPTQVSRAARGEWAKLAANAGYDKLPYWQQTMVLSGFLRGWYYGQTSREFSGERAAFAMSMPMVAAKYDGWHDVERSGFRHEMTIDGEHKIEIYTPAADSPERDNASQAIAGLPYFLRQLIREIKVEPYGTASEFNGGGNTIWVRLKGPASLKTLDSVFAHESGHLLMNRTNCYEPWVAALNKDALSVSEYGRQNPSEDFADFVRLYVSTNDDPAQLESLRTLYPNRMKLLEAVLKEVR